MQGQGHLDHFRPAEIIHIPLEWLGQKYGNKFHGVSPDLSLRYESLQNCKKIYFHWIRGSIEMFKTPVLLNGLKNLFRRKT